MNKLPAQPLVVFIQRRIERYGLEAVAQEFGVVTDAQKRRFLRIRKATGDTSRTRIEDVLAPSPFNLMDIYTDLDEVVDETPSEVGRPRRSLLSEDQVRAAYILHTRGGLSIREIARRGWRKWGYRSQDAARCALVYAFKNMGYHARDRVEVTKAAVTKHGMCDVDHRAAEAGTDKHRARQRYRKVKSLERGAIQLVFCKSTTSKGKPCGRYAMKGSAYCFSHSEEHREEVLAIIANTRDKRKMAA